MWSSTFSSLRRQDGMLLWLLMQKRTRRSRSRWILWCFRCISRKILTLFFPQNSHNLESVWILDLIGLIYHIILHFFLQNRQPSNSSNRWFSSTIYPVIECCLWYPIELNLNKILFTLYLHLLTKIVLNENLQVEMVEVDYQIKDHPF